MAELRELLVRGGRAYIDAGDVAAVIVRGDNFDAVSAPESPIRLLLSGCGDTLDTFGASADGLFFGGRDINGSVTKPGWLNPEKFVRLRVRGGHAFVHTRHVLGIVMSGDSDTAKSTGKHPLTILLRGVRETVVGWGPSALDFMHALQSAGREIKVQFLEAA